MARIEVIKDGTTERIYFYPQEGRPSATPSVEIKDENGNTITAAATTNVTQSTVNTTVGATPGAIGDDSLILTAVTGIEFRRTYLITNSLLQREFVRVKSVNASTKEVVFDEPLEYVHDTAATFQGCYFYYSLQSGEVDALKELYRARATYTVGGLIYTQEIPFDVVLTPLVSPLTSAFVKQRRPDIMTEEHSQTRGSDYLDLRNAAWERVKVGIWSHGWRPALLRTPEDVEEWALAEFDLLAHEAGVEILRGDWAPIDAIEHLEGRVIKKRERSLSSLQFMDLNEDDSRSDDEVAPLRMDLIR